eukprot:m.25256 g.25256  ORF g.25256 m.25256 type:complete len:552 (-) comp14932_c0_seq1:205-1860(-)
MDYTKAVKRVLKDARPASVSTKDIVKAVVNETPATAAKDKDAVKQLKKTTKKAVKEVLDALKGKGKILLCDNGTATWGCGMATAKPDQKKVEKDDIKEGAKEDKKGKSVKKSKKQKKDKSEKPDDGTVSSSEKDPSDKKEKKNKRSRRDEDVDTKKKRKVEKGKKRVDEGGSNMDADEAHAASLVNDTKDVSDVGNKVWVKPGPEQTTILLFYAYREPQFNRSEQDDALYFCEGVLTENGVTGRLRLGREGFNGTLTGPYDGIRNFVAELKVKWPGTFGDEGDCCNNFKYVDDLPPSQRLKGLKVFPVTEIVTYGFDPSDAPLNMRGTHLSPPEWNKALQEPNTICLDVRNFNESLIGKFVPPGDKPITGAPGVVTDMRMRRSTDFAPWIARNKTKLEGKKVLMYCTAGVRCERASAFLKKKGLTNVFQLDGGVHRYLEHFKEDGGLWKGKNYTFDRRFNHGADNAELISECVHCGGAWDRYQANSKCARCKMEVLLCRQCQRTPKPPAKSVLLCPLCKPGGNKAGPQPIRPSKYLEEQAAALAATAAETK